MKLVESFHFLPFRLAAEIYCSEAREWAKPRCRDNSFDREPDLGSRLRVKSMLEVWIAEGKLSTINDFTNSPPSPMLFGEFWHHVTICITIGV